MILFPLAAAIMTEAECILKTFNHSPRHLTNNSNNTNNNISRLALLTNRFIMPSKGRMKEIPFLSNRCMHNETGVMLSMQERLRKSVQEHKRSIDA